MGRTYNGFGIALAWPQTYCKQTGSWYDAITAFLGFSVNRYYKVGHAACVLINKNDGICHYYDFGRYHAPFLHGRVRNINTDNDLHIKTIAIFDEKKEQIINMDAILTELQKRESFHGDGVLWAGYTSLNFEKALNKAIHIQNQSPVKYGPFQYKGTNCSRFVQSVILAGKPAWNHRFKIKFLIPFTPTPITNIKALNHIKTKAKPYHFVSITPSKPSQTQLKTTLFAPGLPENLTDDAQWLSGEGAGSWFTLSFSNSILTAQRYNLKGEEECSGQYKAHELLENFNIKNYKVSYLSHCNQITLVYENNKLVFYRI